MNDDSSLALTMAALCFEHNQDVEQIIADCRMQHGPGKLPAKIVERLKNPISLGDAPDWVKADVPDWIWPAFENNFGEEAINEGAALALSAPLDLRVNRIKATREQAIQALGEMGAKAAPICSDALRIKRAGPQSRLPNVQIEEIYQEGGIEIQDEGSQIIAALVNAKDGDQILDFCAGAGGKTLAISSFTQDGAHITAFDIDKRRLSAIYPRKMRSGASKIKVIQPPLKNLDKLEGTYDKVILDAPCTGVGTWRRKPDAKWRLSEKSLETRIKEQITVLDTGSKFVRSGGLLFYMTCSMLAEENESQVYNFLDRNDNFTLLSAGEVWEDTFGVDAHKPWSEDGCTLTLTPAATDTDGFFFAVMEKAK